jgi:RHS repeat-associated protein
VTHKYGWGGEVQGGTAGQNGPDINRSYTNNRVNGFSYDAAGNLTNDLGQTFTYDATGQQATASYGGYSLTQNYDGDGLRVKKNDNGAQTYYLRSSVLGGQVVAEIIWASVSWQWNRGYVYLGSQLLAVQQAGVNWVHEDPVTKSKRITNSAGAIVSTVELDPWGADTNRSSNAAFQPKKFTTYERDNNGTDEAMFRRYNRWQSRFDQPDPYDGSYDATDPQSFNRYAYVQGDPVNFIDPSGLRWQIAETCSVIDGDRSCRIVGVYWIDDPDPFSDHYGGRNWSGGSGGGERQNTGQQDTRTTCERFADRVQDLANAATSIKGLLDTLATTFLSMGNGHPRNGSISELHAAQGGALVGEARNFSSNDGIRGRFRGVEGGGQIRHFVGALIASSYVGGYLGMMGREGLGRDEESKADRRVNGLANYIHDTVLTAPIADNGFGPASIEQVRTTLADEIRRDLCGP